MKNKLYNVTIGQETTTPAVQANPEAGVEAVPAQASYNANIGQVTVVASDVNEVITKVTLSPGQHIESVEKIRDIDVA